MIVRTIKTTVGEAEEIITDRLRHIYRSDKELFRKGDVIEFLVIKDRKRIPHKIDNASYVITSVENSLTAPVLKRYQIIGFREL